MGSIGLFSIVPRNVLGGNGHIAPSDQLTKAIIGTGGIGRSSYHFTSDRQCRLIALCDVDSKHLSDAVGMAKSRFREDVRAYHDFRDLISNPDVDVVHIATPPHWHAIMAVEAAKAGKDIWCEKPMTRTIGEGKRVVEAVRRYNRIFRLNTWFRFTDTFYGLGTPVMPLKKLVDSGLLGWPLKVVVSGTTGFAWKFFWTGRENLETQPVPRELDYDFWLGPAPFKPYNVHRTHQDLPRILGLRRRRAHRHGTALSRPRAVHTGKGQHVARKGGDRRRPAASRRRGDMAQDNIHI